MTGSNVADARPPLGKGRCAASCVDEMLVANKDARAGGEIPGVTGILAKLEREDREREEGKGKKKETSRGQRVQASATENEDAEMGKASSSDVPLRGRRRGGEHLVTPERD